MIILQSLSEQLLGDCKVTLTILEQFYLGIPRTINCQSLNKWASVNTVDKLSVVLQFVVNIFIVYVPTPNCFIIRASKKNIRIEFAPNYFTYCPIVSDESFDRCTCGPYIPKP